MENYYIALLVSVIVLTLLMVIPLFRGPHIYDRFIGVQVIGSNVILVLVLIGFIDGRRDMYVDIALAYGVLGFVSAIIVAKFLGTRGGDRRGR